MNPGKLMVGVLIHAILIVILALIGSASVTAWQSFFGGVLPQDLVSRLWMIVFVTVVFFVPQWFAFSTVSYVAISYLSYGVWWRRGSYVRFLKTHAWFLLLLMGSFILWDVLGGYVRESSVIIWGFVGIAALGVIYLYLHHRRLRHFVDVAHKECVCIRKAVPWIALHWTGGIVALSLIAFVLPIKESWLEMLVVSGVFGAVLTLDTERFRVVMQTHDMKGSERVSHTARGRR
ncbi:hypothetical protein HY641_00255 [Candidatus Woesearchaeota archaeon]|nr:hypothetical protein [Candidatus Woesearchaeota archaeon]